MPEKFNRMDLDVVIKECVSAKLLKKNLIKFILLAALFIINMRGDKL